MFNSLIYHAAKVISFSCHSTSNSLRVVADKLEDIGDTADMVVALRGTKILNKVENK